MSTRIRLATAAMLLGAALLVASFIPGYGPQVTVFEEAEWFQPEDPKNPVTAVTYWPVDNPGASRELKFASGQEDRDGEPSVLIFVARLPRGVDFAETYTFQITRGSSSESRTVQVLNKWIGLMAIIGGILCLVAGPEALIRQSRLYTRRGQKQQPVVGWTYLLMEPGTGLSIARVQLALLFIPSAVVYVALAFPLHEFPHIPDSIWQLLGIGGATAALSTLITPAGQVTATTSLPLPPGPTGTAGEVVPPPAAQVAASMQEPAPEPGSDLIEVKPPSITNLFEESNGYGDISRYQSMVMCAITAVVFVVSFFDTWQVPDIPTQVLQLLGTSLAVYLGVKGIKVVKESNSQVPNTH